MFKAQTKMQLLMQEVVRILKNCSQRSTVPQKTKADIWKNDHSNEVLRLHLNIKKRNN